MGAGEGMLARYLRGRLNLHLSHARSFATHASIRHQCHFRDKDHVLDILQQTPSRQARQTSAHTAAAVAPIPAFTPSLVPFTIATRSLHVSALLAIATSLPVYHLDPSYRCILKQTPPASLPGRNTQAHDSPHAHVLALLNKRLIHRLRIASQPRSQHGGLRSA